MDFFRHKYTFDNGEQSSQNSKSADWDEHGFADLDSLGFCLVDGTELNSETYKQNPYMKWSKETNTLVDWTNDHRFFQCNGNDIEEYPLGSPGMMFYNSSDFIKASVLFFFPLKNQGFFLQWQRPDGTELNSKLRPWKDFDDTEKTSQIKWIGLHSELTNYSPYDYIKLGRYAPTSSARNIDGHFYTNFSTNENHGASLIIGHNEYSPIPFLDTQGVFEDLPGADEKGWAPLQSVDVNQNVCTLVRVPYDTKFITDLYLVTTSPQESIDGKFFGFSGRQFFGVARNLVVELPVN